MFSSPVFEVVLGLVFIFLLFSLLATTINEILMTFLRARGEDLYKAIAILLDDVRSTSKPKPGETGPVKMVDIFYQHPMILKFAEKGKDYKPSYLSNKNFSKVLMDLITDYNAFKSDVNSLKEQISSKFEENTARLLITFMDEAEGNLQTFKFKLEQWYDEMMDRATGWYKRRVQKMLLLIGFVIALVFNADTLNIAKTLSADPEARAAIVNMADEYVKKDQEVPGANSSGDLNSLNQQLKAVVSEEINKAGNVVGMGWKDEGKYFSGAKSPENGWLFWILLKLVGLFTTAMAISLGAPFWFDLLNKVMKIRGTGLKPEEKSPVVRETLTIKAPEAPGANVHSDDIPAYG